MKHKKRFPYALLIGFTILFSLYGPISAVSFSVYGEELGVDITQTVGAGLRRNLAQAFMAGHLFFSFLLTFNPPAQEIEGMLNIPKSKFLSEGLQSLT